METNNYNNFSPFDPSSESQSLNFGQYNFGDDIKLSYLNATNIHHRFHEIGHYTLAKNTLWGIMIKYLVVFEKYDSYIEELVSVMKDACEEVFESYSIFIQYLSACEAQNKSEAHKVKNNLYYHVYNKDYFDVLESLPFEQIVSFPFHARLARLALGVKLDTIYNPQELKKFLIDNPQMHPDKRFRELILSFKKLLNQKNYTEITDQEILSNCNLTSCEQRVNNLYDYCNFYNVYSL